MKTKNYLFAGFVALVCTLLLLCIWQVIKSRSNESQELAKETVVLQDSLDIRIAETVTAINIRKWFINSDQLQKEIRIAYGYADLASVSDTSIAAGKRIISFYESRIVLLREMKEKLGRHPSLSSFHAVRKSIQATAPKSTMERDVELGRIFCKSKRGTPYAGKAKELELALDSIVNSK